MKSVSVYNHKGGVGKTSFCAAIAGELVLMGKRVLMVDADSQANLTNQFIRSSDLDCEFADYLYADRTTRPEILTRIVRDTKYRNLSILPTKKLSEGGRIDAWARGEASNESNRNVITNLTRYIMQMGFDIVLFDMPPSYTILDQKILLACDEVLPVLNIEKDSVEGLHDFYVLLRDLKDGEDKPMVRQLVFNKRNRTQREQNELMENQIDRISTKKYVFPQEQAFESAKKEMNLLQEYRIKKETASLLRELAESIAEQE